VGHDKRLQECVKLIAGEIDGRRGLQLTLFLFRSMTFNVLLLTHLLATQGTGSLVLLGEPGSSTKNVEGMLAGECEETFMSIEGILTDGTAFIMGHFYWILI